MKTFSFATFNKLSVSTFLRFPLTLLLAIAGTWVTIKATHANPKGNLLSHIDMAIYLAMLLSLSFTLYAEQRQFSSAKKIIGYALSIALIGCYYLLLKNKTEVVNIIQFCLLSIGLHLLVAISPFLQGRETNGFWQFNKTLLTCPY